MFSCSLPPGFQQVPVFLLYSKFWIDWWTTDSCWSPQWCENIFYQDELSLFWTFVKPGGSRMVPDPHLSPSNCAAHRTVLGMMHSQLTSSSNPDWLSSSPHHSRITGQSILQGAPLWFVTVCYRHRQLRNHANNHHQKDSLIHKDYF